MRTWVLAWTSVVLCGLLAACSSSAPAPTDGPARDRGPGVERGAGDGPSTGPDGRTPDAKVAVPDLPAVPTHWVAVPGAVQPQVESHAVALLKNGDVIIAGGYRIKPAGSSWETVLVADTYRYIAANAASNAFEAAGSLQIARAGATATRLAGSAGDKVLVGGGESDAETGEPAADLYDPSKPAGGAWTKAAPLPGGRVGHAAALLGDGRVLVSGGCYYNKSLDSFVAYDPTKDSWSTLASTMKSQRCYHTMTPLSNGKLLIAGGFWWDSSVSPKAQRWLDSLEIFDPVTGTVTAVAAKLSNAASSHTATLLADGRVMILGGWCNSNCKPWLSKGDIYDPATDKITSLALYGDNTPFHHSAVLMADGRLLIAGDTDYPERTLAFSTSGGGSWALLSNLTSPRQSGEAVRLLDGTILLVGGRAAAAPGGIPTHPAGERFVP